jgi:hypothetical protein
MAATALDDGRLGCSLWVRNLDCHAAASVTDKFELLTVEHDQWIEMVIALKVWAVDYVLPPFVEFDDRDAQRKHNGEEYRYLDHHCPVSNADQLFDPRKTAVNSILTTSSKSKPNALPIAGGVGDDRRRGQA